MNRAQFPTRSFERYLDGLQVARGRKLAELLDAACGWNRQVLAAIEDGLQERFGRTRVKHLLGDVASFRARCDHKDIVAAQVDDLVNLREALLLLLARHENGTVRNLMRAPDQAPSVVLDLDISVVRRQRPNRDEHRR